MLSPLNNINLVNHIVSYAKKNKKTIIKSIIPDFHDEVLFGNLTKYGNDGVAVNGTYAFSYHNGRNHVVAITKNIEVSYWRELTEKEFLLFFAESKDLI